MRRPRAQHRWSGSRLRPFSAGMLGVFGQVQVHALTSVGSTGRRGTVVDCYLAQDPGDGSERRSRQSPTVHLVALCLIIEHGIEGRGTFSCLVRPLERWPNFRALGPRHDRDRLTILEMRNWAMRTTTRAAPKPGHTRSGELGRTSSPESETSSSSCCNQTGCSPHRGWIHCGTRSIMDPYAMGSCRRRPVSGSACGTAVKEAAAPEPQ